MLCSGQLLGGCYAVTRVFWVVARAFLHSCYGVLVVDGVLLCSYQGVFRNFVLSNC